MFHMYSLDTRISHTVYTCIRIYGLCHYEWQRQTNTVCSLEIVGGPQYRVTHECTKYKKRISSTLSTGWTGTDESADTTL